MACVSLAVRGWILICGYYHRHQQKASAAQRTAAGRRALHARPPTGQSGVVRGVWLKIRGVAARGGSEASQSATEAGLDCGIRGG